jgi:ferric-dicitrate binding protein FerR (iron transport regulator)
MWLLLDRYLRGDASVTDAETVRAWLVADPARVEVIDDLKRIRELSMRRPPARNTDEAWRAVARAADIAPVRTVSAPSPIRRISHTNRAWLAAAAAVVVVGGALALQFIPSRGPAKPAGTGPVAPHVYTTQRGQRAEVLLADGTRVALAPESRLVVPADFDSVRREVTIEGRGFLNVIHNSRKPFVVRARSAVALDVGTTFEVRAYPEDPDVIILVSEGVVSLRDSSAGRAGAVLMKRGAMGRVDRSGSVSVTTGVDVERVTRWTEGRLEFTRTRLPEALAELARWYDVDVRIADA